MKLEILASRIIWTDDTTVPVLDPTQSKNKSGRMWVYIGDLRHRYAVLDYSPDRKGSRPREFLGDYGGYLQADAYAGYDQLRDHSNLTEVACWAHPRRRFREAKDSARVPLEHFTLGDSGFAATFLTATLAGDDLRLKPVTAPVIG